MCILCVFVMYKLADFFHQLKAGLVELFVNLRLINTHVRASWLIPILPIFAVVNSRLSEWERKWYNRL